MLLLLSATLAPSASACSICRCGDPTFNALGAAIYAPGQFRLALDWERFDKENGVSDPGSWGRNDLAENGQRLDEHAQSGTGGTPNRTSWTGTETATRTRAGTLST